MTKKFWFDTEFIENPGTIDLISIGIVDEFGNKFYGINQECDFSKADDWVKKNVLSYLKPNDPAWMTKTRMKDMILEFIGKDTPEFWAYFADYDWVVFCWIFGKMIDLPKGWPMYCKDLQQLVDELGIKNLDKLVPQKDEHHALKDAEWTKEAWEFVQDRMDSLREF